MRAYAEKQGEGICLTTSDDGFGLQSFDLSMDVCRKLRRRYPDLKIGPALNEWAWEQRRAERLAQVAPKLASALHGYQRQAAAFGAKTGSFLLADQQGLGKTIEALATIVERCGDSGWHLIMTPVVAVEGVWAAEIKRWLPDATVLTLTGSLKERQRALTNFTPRQGLVFVIANLESARIKPVYKDKDKAHKYPQFKAENAVLPALFARRWDTVVVDECQRALIRGKSQIRGGFSLLAANSVARIALSGTPMRGKPEQLWGTLNWLRPDVYTAYWTWVKRYFELTSNGYSNYLLNGFKPGGEHHLAGSLKDIMLRRTKGEVLPELPAKTYAGTLLDPNDEGSPCGIWLDMTAAQREQVNEFERDGMLDFGDDGEIVANNALAAYTRGKQLANTVHVLNPATGKFSPTLDSPKYEWLLNFLSELDGEKVVVASQFTTIIDVFADGLARAGYSVCTLTGKTPRKARDALVWDFQNRDDGPQVFMLNTKAGGVALTLDAADYLVLLDETTVPDDQEQVEDRIHRASRVHNVTIYYLRTMGTLDEEISWIAAAREDVQKYLLDGARGIEYARKRYEQYREQQKKESA